MVFGREVPCPCKGHNQKFVALAPIVTFVGAIVGSVGRINQSPTEQIAGILLFLAGAGWTLHITIYNGREHARWEESRKPPA